MPGAGGGCTRREAQLQQFADSGGSCWQNEGFHCLILMPCRRTELTCLKVRSEVVGSAPAPSFANENWLEPSDGRAAFGRPLSHPEALMVRHRRNGTKV